MGRRVLYAMGALLVVAGIGLAAWALAAPRDHEATATATLPGAVWRADALRAIESPAIARRGLSLVSARGWALTFHYRSDASATRVRRVAIGAARQVSYEALSLSVTRADRQVVDARERGDADGTVAAERAAQEARRAGEASLDVRVETATADEARWRSIMAAAIGVLSLGVILTITTLVVATVAARRAPRVPLLPAPVALHPTPEPDPERLDVEEIGRRLSALARQASVANTTRLST